MDPVVEFRRVGFRYGGRDVLQEVGFTVNPGETVVLLGRSGSGKTTALRLVNAMLLPGEGEVLVEGRPTSQWDAVRLRRRTGYAMQDAGLFPHYTVARNVGLVPRLEGWPEERVEARVRELLDLVGLAPDEFGPRFPRHLSGGQRQRVGVARALAADPPLLLLDEPFGALDPVTRVELQRQFAALQQRLGKAALLVTHDVREAVHLGHRIVLLHQGRVAVDASPDAFLASDDPEAREFRACLEW